MRCYAVFFAAIVLPYAGPGAANKFNASSIGARQGDAINYDGLTLQVQGLVHSLRSLRLIFTNCTWSNTLTMRGKRY